MQQAGVKTDDYVGDLVKLYQADGKTYALPKDQGALALFVNNDMAQQAGIDIASLKSWDDLTAAAKKMTSGEGPGKIFGMCVDADPQRVSAFLLQNNNPILQDNKAVFNQESGVQAVEWWYGFKKDGTGEFAKNMGADWCGDAFSKKKTGMVVEGGWLLPFMTKQAPDIKYTAMPIPPPQGGKQATLVFTNGWAASASTKYPNAAAALALFLTSAANQQPILQTGFALPTVKSLLNDPYFQSHPNDKVLADAPAYGSVADLVFGGPAKKEDVLKILKEQAFDPIFTTGADIKTSLDNAAQQVDQKLSASS
jgi:multiple sugar transport system substrate-binding protein